MAVIPSHAPTATCTGEGRRSVTSHPQHVHQSTSQSTTPSSPSSAIPTRVSRLNQLRLSAWPQPHRYRARDKVFFWGREKGAQGDLKRHGRGGQHYQYDNKSIHLVNLGKASPEAEL